MKKLLYNLLLLPILFFITNNIQAQTLHWQGSNGPDGWVVCLAVGKTAVFAGSLNNGLARSTDNGATWQQPVSDVPQYAVRTLAASGSTIFASVDNSGGALYRSTDDGMTWAQSDTDIYSPVIVINGSTIFVAAYSNINYLYSVQRSTDNGNTWEQVKQGLTDTSSIAFIAMHGRTIFTAMDDTLYRSTDNGDNWTNALNGLVSEVTFKDSTVFAVKDGMLYRSSNNGYTWTPLKSETTANVGSLDVSTTAIFAETTSGVYRSTDDGDTWTKVFNGLVNDYVIPISGTTILACGDSIYLSTNNGDTWVKADSGLYDAIRAFALNKTTIFAGSYDGVFRADISQFTTTVSEPTPVSPTLMLTVQPNPARDEMLVRYNAVSANAELELFNALGERVMSELVNASGETAFDVSTLPAGMYLLALRSTNATKTQTVMVVR
ncbi:MAG TPA: T9SS type A sorting domain-containing protein [Candidatus Kapabacteria bacterium]|nr:T9SS type A sorting domain-containing protein [Candidatus Kapabacteria bacterium]